MSKLMERKKKWARDYAAENRAMSERLRKEARNITITDRARSRYLNAAATMLDADARCKVIGIRDMRSGGNKLAMNRTVKDLNRAIAHFANLNGIKPQYEFGFSYDQEQKLWEKVRELWSMMPKRPSITDVREAWNVAKFMEPATVGNASIQSFIVDDKAADLSRLRSVISSSSGGRWTPVGAYVKLVVNDEIWMSDTPDEFMDHYAFISHARGRVLVHGLGLGCVVSSLLAKPEVEHIDVVELNPDVIALVGPYYEGKRVTIHHGNAATYKWPRGTTWTCVWHDIWASIGSDNLRDETAENGISYEKMHRKFGHRCGWQESWAYHLAVDARERDRRRESRAQSFVRRYNRASHDRRVVMLLQGTTPALMSTEQWAEAAKVLPGPKGDGTALDHFKCIAQEDLTVASAYWLVT